MNDDSCALTMVRVSAAQSHGTLLLAVETNPSRELTDVELMQLRHAVDVCVRVRLSNWSAS